MNNLAVAYQAAGKLDLALPLYEETLKLTKAKLGPDHPDTLTSMNNLAGLSAAGKLDLALPLYEETLKLQSQARPRSSRHARQHEQPRRAIRTPASRTWPCRFTRRRSSSGKPSSAPTIPTRSTA